jgi:hypothetical protein
MATTNARPRARTFRVLPIAVLLVVAFLVGLFGASQISSALSAQHTVAWGLAVGIGGPKYDRAAAQDTRVVNVEVQWPACVPTQDDSWLRSDVSYTPWSVTITLHTSDAYANNPKCSKPRADGLLPVVGYYLSALSFPVQLSEPLAGRDLFDGSAFPAAARPYR